MRDRTREFAKNSHAHHMRELLALQRSFSLGFPASPALKQNVADKDGLQRDDRRDGDDRPAMLIPNRRLAKVHNAARRQSGFADAPALQLPAVIDRRSEQYRWRIDSIWPLTVQYSQS